MSEGRIEQIGTPAEIYNFPATRFVASFVGTLNLLTAQVVDARAGRLSVHGQEIQAAKPIDDGHGGVSIALRPESIELGENGGSNRLRGPLEDVSFLGSIVRMRVGLGNGTAVSLDTFNDPHLALPAVGETVTVSFPREACLVLASASAPAPAEDALAV
jgi:putative spermidine/putrescine transport system ATP-binding protein